jgi:uncharacterized protein (DUF1800 family)
MGRRARAGAVVALLAFCACGGGGSGGGGSGGEASSVGPSLETHVLARAGYGPDRWSEERIAALGVDAYLEEQLHPESIPDDALEARLAGYGSLGRQFQELVVEYADAPSLPLRELQRARLLRAALSRRQLEQMLVDFWSDHFNVYAGGGRTQSFAVVAYERDAIRPFVLGRFADLLTAVARSAAMLYYLDNFVSVREGFSDRGARRGLNENYARELLELHTVGVEAGYTQQDVLEVARAFTGWTAYAPPEGGPDGFYFYAEGHDRNAKRVMDLALPAGRGLEDGLDLLAYLAAHPGTARRVCAGLAVRFVSESPGPRLLDECVQAYRSSGGDLEDVMRTLFASPEFRDPRQRGAKHKRPLVFVASLLRATGAQPGDDTLDRLLDDLARLGEAPWLAHPPSGVPDDSAHWTGGAALLARFGIVARVTDADAALRIDWRAPASAPPGALVDSLGERLLPRPAGTDTRAAVVARLEAIPGASDAARVREAAALLLASPEFMQH